MTGPKKSRRGTIMVHIEGADCVIRLEMTRRRLVWLASILAPLLAVLLAV